MWFSCVNNIIEVYFHVCEFAFTNILTGEIQLYTTFLFLQAIYAVVPNPSAMLVTPGNYRLVSGQRPSLNTVPPPRDRLCLVGQYELVSLGFVPDHIHGANSSTLMSPHNCLALADTNIHHTTLFEQLIRRISLV